MGKRHLPGLAAGLLTGLAATATMTATTSLERRLRPGISHPVDYDASRHVVTAVATVLRREPRTSRERAVYFALAHWGYGSAMGLGYPLARRLAGDDGRSAALFWSASQVMAMAMFPTLGGAPPPWSWRRDVMASSLAQHGVYTAVVVTGDRLRRRAGSDLP